MCGVRPSGEVLLFHTNSTDLITCKKKRMNSSLETDGVDSGITRSRRLRTGRQEALESDANTQTASSKTLIGTTFT